MTAPRDVCHITWHYRQYFQIRMNSCWWPASGSYSKIIRNANHMQTSIKHARATNSTIFGQSACWRRCVPARLFECNDTIKKTQAWRDDGSRRKHYLHGRRKNTSIHRSVLTTDQVNPAPQIWTHNSSWSNQDRQRINHTMTLTIARTQHKT